MDHLFLPSFLLSIFLGLLAATSWLPLLTSRTTFLRVQQVTRTGKSLSSKRRRQNIFELTASSIAQWLRSHFGLSQHSGLGDRMSRAGYRGVLPLDVYTAARVTLPMLFFLFAIFIPVARIFWMLSLPALAYLIPDLVLEQRIRQRRDAIRRSMPDTIDLLVICVDAGLGLDQAMLRVAQELGTSHPEMHDEFIQINGEQRAGKPRIDAWNTMTERIRLPEMDAFVNMLMQTERFGTPISKALSTFAAVTRLKRTQRAEENAAKTTIKIIFPLVIFILPSIFIVLLGPAALSIVRGFTSAF